MGKGADISYKDFSTFCPKAIAGIGKLPDTVADRSIPVRLKRATRGERRERFRRRKVQTQADRLREEAQVWAGGAIEVLRDAEPSLPEQLSDRQQDGAEPLLAIADAAGDRWPKVAREALVELCAGEQAEDDSVGVRLLADIHAIFAEAKADKIPSAELIEALAQIETSPWGEWNKGKPITQASLARLLRPFSIAPKNIRIGEKTPKGYDLEALRDAFQRYLPSVPPPSPAPESATPPQGNIHATSDEFSNRHTEENVAGKNSDNSSETKDVADVAVPEDGVQAKGSQPRLSTACVLSCEETPIRPCSACHGIDYWISVHGATICSVCHPPANPSLVKKLISANRGASPTQ